MASGLPGSCSNGCFISRQRRRLRVSRWLGSPVGFGGNGLLGENVSFIALRGFRSTVVVHSGFTAKEDPADLINVEPGRGRGAPPHRGPCRAEPFASIPAGPGGNYATILTRPSSSGITNARPPA